MAGALLTVAPPLTGTASQLHPAVAACFIIRGSVGWHKILKLRTDTSGFEEVWSFGISRCESGLSQLFKQCTPGQPSCHLCNCVVPNIFAAVFLMSFCMIWGYAAPVGRSNFQRRWSCSLCVFNAVFVGW